MGWGRERVDEMMQESKYLAALRRKEERTGRYRKVEVEFLVDSLERLGT